VSEQRVGAKSSGAGPLQNGDGTLQEEMGQHQEKGLDPLLW